VSPVEYMPLAWVAGPLVLIALLLLLGGRRRLRPYASLALLAGFAMAALVSIFAAELFWGPGPTPAGQPAVIVVEQGSTPAGVAARLEEEGIVRRSGDLVLAARMTFADRSLQAGRYHFAGGERILDVLSRLTHGGTARELVTIPEGLRAPLIASIVSREAQVDSVAFVTMLADSAFIAGLLPPEEGAPLPPSLEGYLLPETYNIYYRMPAAEVLRLMVGHFTDLWERRLGEAAAELGMTRHEVVTLASIIEREAATGEERRIISAVFHNRLRRGMRLESCATVLYALGRFKRRLYEKDLQVDSPYNTYRVRGLPPGPIANAGAASLMAAISPAGVNYLYFVARGDGTHVFSRTFAEHVAAKRGQGSGVLVGGRAAREAGGASTSSSGDPPETPGY